VGKKQEDWCALEEIVESLHGSVRYLWHRPSFECGELVVLEPWILHVMCTEWGIAQGWEVPGCTPYLREESAQDLELLRQRKMVDMQSSPHSIRGVLGRNKRKDLDIMTFHGSLVAEVWPGGCLSCRLGLGRKTSVEVHYHASQTLVLFQMGKILILTDICRGVGSGHFWEIPILQFYYNYSGTLDRAP